MPKGIERDWSNYNKATAYGTYPWAKSHGKDVARKRTFRENLEFLSENLLGLAGGWEYPAYRATIRQACYRILSFIDKYEEQDGVCKTELPNQFNTITQKDWEPQWRQEDEEI